MYSTKIQGVVTLIGPVEPFVTGIKMKSRNQDVNFIKVIKGWLEEMIKHAA